MRIIVFLVMICVLTEAQCNMKMGCMKNYRQRACKNETKKLERMVKRLAFKNRINRNRLATIESTFVLPELPVDRVSTTTNKRNVSTKKELTKEEKAKIELIKKDQTPSEDNIYVKAMNSYFATLKPVVKEKKLIKRYIVHTPCTGDLCKFLNKKLKVPKCKDKFKPSQCMKLGYNYKAKVQTMAKQKCLL
ncbi:hypothetical protein ENU1_106210 [Entamoeba nuttalli P19]|uniref:Ribosomal protein L7a n=1 Tax=Entamoeba nuttalli (strain P19) TaxID=1076696 RepID=K2GBS0_ENTNP|nr:hypothetical protein ENU1_106210 [Entamoeba nuttalli P19]EKE39996.1 hypothetical protein ENU1_106210 [Entamoeba nuttalli P19]|eukprot:XP_008857666.1 hypothetical protein ENU1_106210 [Entamoeba nuttalli P19]